MKSCVIPTDEPKPDNIIVHTGTNDLKTINTLEELIMGILNLAMTCKTDANSVFICGIVPRSDKLNPQSAHCFLKCLKKRSQFRCTGLLHSSKLVNLDGKNLTCFIQKLVHNLMNLVLGSKSDKK